MVFHCFDLRLALLALVAVLNSTAQAQAPDGTAAAGARPPVKLPLGPVPGAAEQTVHPDSPYAGDKVALMEGRRLFVGFNCAGCHGGHGGGGMGPSLRDRSWVYGGKPAEVYASIAEGRAYGMPAWGTLLPREQIWKLVAYIGSLRTPLEPQPPQ